jgi:hypothetical protein
MQVPETVAFSVSGPPYITGAEQEAMPENALPLNDTENGRSYQPFESGRLDTIAEAVGFEASTWSVYVRERLSEGQFAVHETFVTVSRVNCVTTPSRHVVLVGAGFACHTTETGPAYQSPLHVCADPPSVQVAETSSAQAAAALTSNTPTTTTAPTSPSRLRRRLKPIAPATHHATA